MGCKIEIPKNKSGQCRARFKDRFELILVTEASTTKASSANRKRRSRPHSTP
jgi:uncharacterized protein YegP (UPF0339 family)